MPTKSLDLDLDAAITQSDAPVDPETPTDGSVSGTSITPEDADADAAADDALAADAPAPGDDATDAADAPADDAPADDSAGDDAPGAAADAAGDADNADDTENTDAQPAQGDGAVSPAQGNAGLGALPDPSTAAGSVDASGGGSVDAIGTTVTGTPADNTGAGNVPGAPADGPGGTGDVAPGVAADPLPGDASSAQPAATVAGIDPAGNAGIQVPANPAPLDPIAQAGAQAASGAQPAPITQPGFGAGSELGGGVAAVANDPQDPTTAGGLADGSISNDASPSDAADGAADDAAGDAADGAPAAPDAGDAPAAPAPVPPAAPDLDALLQGVQDKLAAEFTAGVDSIEATLEATFAQMKADILDKLNAYNDAQMDRAEGDANQAIDDTGFLGTLGDALKDATDKYFGAAKTAAQAVTAALPDKALQGFKLSAAAAIETLKHIGQADLSQMSGAEKEMVDKLKAAMGNLGQHGLAFFHTQD